MAVRLVLKKEAQSLLYNGIRKLYQAVSSTLGPEGKLALIAKENNKIHVTKDGATVAKELRLPDEIEMMGAQMLRETAEKTAQRAGDGTTTSIILAHEMIARGINLASLQNFNLVKVLNKWESDVDFCLSELNRISRKIETEAALIDLAKTSLNGDQELAELIAPLVYKMGSDGVITIERSATTKTYVSYVLGLQINAPYCSPYLVNAPKIMSTVFATCMVFLYDGEIYNIGEVLPVLEYSKANNKPVLILANDIGESAEKIFVDNVVSNTIQVSLPKLIGTAEQKRAVMEDIAALTGAKIFKKGLSKFDMGRESVKPFIGYVDRLENNDSHLTLVTGPRGNLSEHLEKLQEEYAIESNEMLKEALQWRMRKLKGGVAVIYTGAPTELEMLEKKDRIEDAVLATKSALRQGYYPGAGTAFLRISQSNRFMGGERVEADSFGPILESVREHLFASAHIEHRDLNTAINLKTHEISNKNLEDFYDALGVYDSIEVLSEALKNAFSVAKMILLTSSVIYKEYEIINGPPRLGGYQEK